MGNLSEKNREKMISFLDDLKNNNKNNEELRWINEIENYINEI